MKGSMKRGKMLNIMMFTCLLLSGCASYRQPCFMVMNDKGFNLYNKNKDFTGCQGQT